MLEKLDSIFPSFIYSSILTTVNDQSLIELAYELKSTDSGVIKSNKRGWQSDNIVENTNISFCHLKNTLTSEISKVIELTNLNLDLEIDNIWININPPDSYNLQHIHPESFLSGVYYVKIPTGDCGNLVFSRSDGSRYLFNDSSQFFETKKVYPPMIKSVRIFPSWLEHYVDVNNTREDRISISWNTKKVNK